MDSSENMPLFSVVIPTYNREKTIKRSIESVLKQVCQDFEIIVVDDGSEDKTRDVVLLIKDSRIHYVYQKNQGAQVARNTGLRIARGEYISFLDSDDEWDATFLSEAERKFKEDSTIGCTYCLMGNKDSVGNRQLALEDHLQGDIYIEALEQGYITAPSSLVIKKSCFDEVGEWDVSFHACQDDDMCFRLAQKYRYALIPDALCIMHSDYSGCENRISASATRVANGWWQLWNKYEKDVLQYCGTKTMGKHYLKCARYFAQANDVIMRDEAVSRALEFYDFESECERCLKNISPKKFYCYGAGEYALNIAKYLLLHHYKIAAFLVSDGNSKRNSILGIPIIYVSDLVDEDDFSVLLTTSKKYHEDIKNTLKTLAINNIYTVTEDCYSWMCIYVMKNCVDKK